MFVYENSEEDKAAANEYQRYSEHYVFEHVQYAEDSEYYDCAEY